MVMFKKYDKEIKDLTLENKGRDELKKILKRHLLLISFIQHERLVHLIITVFVGTMLCIFFVATVLIKSTILAILTLILLILFTFYIFHYRYLENLTQSWYRLAEEIRYQM